MGTYDFLAIEAKWQAFWKENRSFAIDDTQDKPKYYVLDMFPYPSGAGLHVGHPLGYIATDIVARYRRSLGYNVLHPMGYDAFGLPAEQYAIQTGQHPAATTKANVAIYQKQLNRIGLGYDPDTTEMRTCDPEYYRWTQWVFLQIFHSWYNLDAGKAEHIDALRAHFARGGSASAHAHHDYKGSFTAAEWKAMSEEDQAKILLDYRMAYIAYAEVNWCEALGTVLANDEVVNGVSERGGHPVERRAMRQWAFRMRAYADRLLEGLNTIDWPDPIKEMQRNWIGRSEGASIVFEIDGHGDKLEVFSTRPDTIFGATYMVLAPEHPLVEKLVSDDRREDVMEYVNWSRNRTEVERQQEKKVSGKFTGAYCNHPFIAGKKMPIWTADYVLWGYGTGAIMSVPAGDSRDYAFAKHFDIEIVPIVEGADISEEAYEQKAGKFINSDFLNGMDIKEAIPAMIREMEKRAIGEGQINYRLRDPNFSRQRYWGEPFPIIYRNDIPYALDESELPLLLPDVESYGPGGDGEGPLANVTEWVNLPDGSRRETNTMPGYAGSSWYFLRYFDVNNQDNFTSGEKADYWMNVDLYVGGAEHAVGHLLYSRYWTKVLFDLGHIKVDEPFSKLVNQGMIQGRSAIIYHLHGTLLYFSFGHVEEVTVDESDLAAHKNDPNTNEQFDSIGKLTKFDEYLIAAVNKQFPDLFNQEGICPAGQYDHIVPGYFSIMGYAFDSKRVNVNFVENDILDLEQVRNWHVGDFANAEFITEEDGKFHTGWQVEKMGKRYYNVVNPEVVCDRYGADTFRLYEMFLGPLQDAKPWNTSGIEGCWRFLRKAWNLFTDDENNITLSNAAPSADELRILHQTIVKVQEDIESLSFNTSVAQFMKFVNEAGKLKTTSRAVLEPFLVLLAPFAPHVCEELWAMIGHNTPIVQATWPEYKEEYTKESSITYPIQFNGKVRTRLDFPADFNKTQIEESVLANAEVQEIMDGKPPRKVIVVPGRIVNIVI